MPAIFNVRDFGARGDGVNDDRVAIQSAIDAANAQAGGGTVYIPTGVYILSAKDNGPDKPLGGLFLKDNVTIQGDGIGLTTLKAIDGLDTRMTGMIRTYWNQPITNAAVKDLTLDGNRDNVTGKVDAFFVGVKPYNTGTQSNITVDGVEARDCSGYGFDPHEITYNLTIKNSIAHDNGLDGFVGDYLVNSTFQNNIAWSNDRHGFNITTSTDTLLMKDDIAFENGGAGAVFQRGDFDIAWPNRDTIQGGSYFDNALEGVNIRLSDNIVVQDADIYGNMRQGLRFRGATNSLAQHNTIRNNSQAGTGVYDEVQILEEQDPVVGVAYGSVGNTVYDNLIYANEVIKSRYGVREQLDASHLNAIRGNVVIGTGAPKISASDSVIVKFDPKNPGDPAPGAYKIGTDLGEYITGKSGNDTIYAGLGNDTISASSGNDTMSGGDGADSIYGGSGNDKLYGDIGADTLLGGDGDDSAFGDAGNDSLNGGKGNDVLIGGDGDDIFQAGTGDDTILGGDGNDSIYGESNNDSIMGNAGDDFIYGGTGNDTIYANEGADTISADSGNDLLVGGTGNDSLLGGDGNDRISADEDSDTVGGGKGNDTINGGDGNDYINGDADNDYLVGGYGDDSLNGGVGNDFFFGGDGNDSLVGGIDLNVDSFFFSALNGNDTVVNFDVVRDVIQITSDVKATVAEVLAATADNASGSAVVDLGVNGSITISGVHTAQLLASDFIII